MNAIEIRELHFSYGNKNIFRDFNLEIEEGMFGLLGRNGAGKTTLMKLLVTLLPLKSGEIRLNNIPIENKKQIRKMIGYLPQDFDFYPRMSVEEALFYLGTLSSIPRSTLKARIDELLGLVHLENERKTKTRKLSGGMKRRLGIAQCLLHDPQVIIVDEPTAGLDPEERIRFRNLLSELAKTKTVLFSTHIASDLESTTEQIAILDQGNLLYKGSVRDLLHESSSSTYQITLSDDEYESFKKSHLIFEQKETSQGIHLSFIHTGIPEKNFDRIPSTLEAAYLYKLHQERRAK